jgi:hypothetical protein
VNVHLTEIDGDEYVSIESPQNGSPA